MVYPGLIQKVRQVLTVTLTALISISLGSSVVVAAPAVRSDSAMISGPDCEAFDSLLDAIEAKNGLGNESSDSKSPDGLDNPNVMAALAECVVRGAMADESLVSQILHRLTLLESTQLTESSELKSVRSLLLAMKSLDSKRQAAALFAANAIIQVSEASRFFDSPHALRHAVAARLAVADFASYTLNYASEDAQSLQRRVSELSRTVTGTLQLASLGTRRDMVASVALRLAVYSQKKGGGYASQVQGVNELFDEINDKFNAFESGDVTSEESTASIAEWLVLFDDRLLAIIRQVEPSAATVATAVAAWHSEIRASYPELNLADRSAMAQSENWPDARGLVELAPDQMRSEVYELSDVLRKAIPQVRAALEKSSGILDRSMFGRQSEALAALRQIDSTMVSLGARVRRTTSPEMLVGFWRAKDQIKLLSIWSLEAAVTRSRTALPLVASLSGAIHRIRSADEPFLNATELSRVHAIIRDQTSEGWVRAFVNRRMAVVYAQSALLLGEAIAVPFTGGASGAAMPATLHAIVTGLQIVGRGTMIVTSSLNIADRYAQDGLRGLVNPASGLDALTIAMLLPRPVPGPVDASTWFGRMMQSGKNQTASWLHEAGRFAVVGHAAFGAYQLAFAEKIASTLRLQGHQATTADVRRQAIGHFAQAFLLGLVEFGEYQRGQAIGGDHHTQMVADSNPIRIIGRRLRNMIFPHKAVLDAYNRLAPTIGSPLAAAAALLPGAAYVAYDYVVASEALMYFYAGSDFGYFAHSREHHEYPELEPGETAVSFIGFDEADLLYAGAHAIDAHRLELEKYGERYFIYDYRSREDFLTKLQEHARRHGPVKFLRFMTHGLPGKLYTGDVQVSAGDGEDAAQRDGWIDASWISANKERIQAISREAIAPDARTIIFACLVGANLDQPAPGLDVNSGDDFLKSFGTAFLSRGGIIDASVRYLIGLDTVYGSMLNWAARDAVLRSSGPDHQPVLPLNIFQKDSRPGLANQGYFVSDDSLRLKLSESILNAAIGDGLVLADDSGWELGGEMLKYSAARMWKMLTQLHKLGIRYGINLEGPWWSTPRYKHAIVEPIGSSAFGEDEVNVRILTE